MLRHWIDVDKIEWIELYKNTNPRVVHLLEQYPDKINWEYLSSNPYALPLLEENQNKINWESLSGNPNAMHLLEQKHNLFISIL